MSLNTTSDPSAFEQLQKEKSLTLLLVAKLLKICQKISS
ncbi:NAD(P)H-quinone oxidoreductase chain K [Crocosphaera watsonii WH 0402]|uniref:NAD(P)H-quinone oxidoreductase chain K n=1 Tax=Crocosphaera watsonii WH 0402 TaxID=1284629 RepID=T2JMV8_CROWT|nr:NAD(P)H-quinone oxidoreductase chain K [Crocosphaera watsonii WH 0402]